jgi:aminoglycoside phosphotransferase (APT) family kinase protein
VVAPDSLRPILTDLGLSPAAAITPLAGGVFRVELADGTALVLKSFAAAHLAPRRDAYAASLLDGLDVPVTRYLLVDESCDRLPFPFALTSYLEGTSAMTFAAHPGFSEVLRQIGRLSRRLHEVKLSAYGSFQACGGPASHASNAAYLRELGEATFDRFGSHGGEPELTARLRAIFERAFDAVVPQSGPAVFAHDDLHPANVLVVERNGELLISGLIDYGNARASSAVMDLAKTIFCTEHMVPGSGTAILDGYGPIGHPGPPDALAFYTLLHRMTMWYWLRQIGALPTADAPSDLMAKLRATAAR